MYTMMCMIVLMTLGGYRLGSEGKTDSGGLSFRQRDFDRQAREMSGGWVMRAHLAAF